MSTLKRFFKPFAKLNLTHWILISLVLGFLPSAPGTPELVPSSKPFRGLFLNGIKCIIAPLILATIVSGIAGAGSFQQLGVMGVRAFIYFEAATTLALVVGLAAVNILRPGDGVHLAGAHLSDAAAQATQTHLTFGGFVGHLLPTNIIDAIARGDVLQVVVRATPSGFSLLAIGDKAKPIVALCESLAEAMFKFTGYIMLLAPLGVGATMAVAVSEQGWQVILPMLKLVGSLYVALAIFVIVCLLPVFKLAGIPLKAFVRELKNPVILAFATASSESAYPSAMERARKSRYPPPHHELRAANGLLLQSGRVDTLSRARFGVYRTGRRDRIAAFNPTFNDADLDAHEQRRRRRAACLDRRALGDSRCFRPADRRDRAHFGRGYFHGHGPHRGQPARQLPGHRRSRALGRREARSATHLETAIRAPDLRRASVMVVPVALTHELELA